MADTLLAFGESLRAARLKRGRSLDDLASSLKINRRHLEAIEAGNLSSLPQGPYATAFIREYSRALGLEVPLEFAAPNAAPPAGIRDPKVVSHPARPGSEQTRRAPDAPKTAGDSPKTGGTSNGMSIPHESGTQLSHVARDTARLANTAVKTAVKTVTKTTENVVNMVETGGKEALEVLTSRSLWDEAENTRRERHGLPPIERTPVERVPAERKVEERIEELQAERKDEIAAADMSFNDEANTPFGSQTYRIRTTKRATNLVIVLLAILFAGAAYFAIKLSGNGTSNSVVTKDYIPAPVDKPPPIPVVKPNPVIPPAITNTTTNPNDSLRLILRATQPVWVSIAPDGIPAYRGELKAGEVRSFRAGSKIEINLGNQKSVAMEFNGAPLSGLPTIPNSGVVVRDLVLMRDRATLGGTPLDINKLTSAASPPKAVVGTAAPSAVSHAPAPNRPKIAGVPPKVRPSAASTASKGNSPNKAKHPVRKQPKKAVKKDVAPPVLHEVEPVPPR